MSQTAVSSKGIFHGLPVLATSGPKRSVLIAGANGITGAHIVRVLKQAPERWENIYALSRKESAEPWGGNVSHIAVDLLAEPTVIAKTLVNIPKLDFVFFAAYMQPPPAPGQGLWSDAAETERVNVALLRNLLSALDLSAHLSPSRFVLQTGAKHYGVHLGPTLSPMEEDDPRFTEAPNFYFPQEDLLWKWSEARSPRVAWNVTRPGFIIGAVPEAAMSIALGLGLYASVQRELGGKLEFPGDREAWNTEKHDTSAELIGYHAEWLLLSEGTENTVLNVADGSTFTYGKFWPLLAAAFGVDYAPPEVDDAEFQTVSMNQAPPPAGFGGPGKFRIAGSLEAWAKKPEVKAAWVALKKKHGLVFRTDPFEDPKDVFGLLDGELLGNWPRSLSMTANRKLGWHGYVDTKDSFLRTFEELAGMKMLPPFKTPEALKVKYVGYED